MSLNTFRRMASLIMLAVFLASGFPFSAHAAPLQHGGGGKSAPAKPATSTPILFEEALPQDMPARFRADALDGRIFFAPDHVRLVLPVEEEDVSTQSGSLDTNASAHATADSKESSRVDTSPRDKDRGNKKRIHAAIEVAFLGGNPATTILATGQITETANYFFGNDPAQWRTNVPSSLAITYDELWPGIDLRYDSLMGKLKGTYIVDPGANPEQIRWKYNGATRVQVEPDGSLAITLPKSGKSNAKRLRETLFEDAPIAWQEVNGRRQEVHVDFVIDRDETVKFAIEDYDPALPLIIDPTIGFSTLTGGSDRDYVENIAVDGSGNSYITGWTESIDYPNTLGAPVTSTNRQVFVTKFNPSGTTRMYSVYFGGSSSDYGNDIIVDTTGAAYIVGTTFSSNFPSLSGYDTTYATGGDAFVAKLAPNGQGFTYNTLIGGGGGDTGNAIALDSSGNVYITGETGTSYFSGFPLRSDFPVKYPDLFDAYLVKLNVNATQATGIYIGGLSNDVGYGIAVDSTGAAYITGRTLSSTWSGMNGRQTAFGGGNTDAFIAKIQPDGITKAYTTYLGGSGNDMAYDIAVDGSSNAYVVGETTGGSFPVVSGGYDTTYNTGSSDGFITMVNASGTAWTGSIFLGSNQTDILYGISLSSAAVAVTGVITTLGTSPSAINFPLKDPSFPIFTNDIMQIGVVSTVSKDLKTLLFSSYLGGGNKSDGSGIAVDATGNIYVGGTTSLGGFPAEEMYTTPGAVGRAFVRPGTVNTNDGPQAFAVKFDTRAMVPALPATTYQANDWTLTASVSSDDGLMVNNAKLATRLMAQQISLPYVQLKTSKVNNIRMELRPNNFTSGVARSQLIGLWTAPEIGLTGANGVGIQRFVIEALYRLDKFANSSTSVLFVRQRYEFYQAIGESDYPELACEPSEEKFLTSLLADFTCARWKPMYQYGILLRDGETLTSVKMPERLHFTPDGQPLRGNAIIRDCAPTETGTSVNPCLFTQGFTGLNLPTYYAASSNLQDNRPAGGINTGEPVPGIQLLNNDISLAGEQFVTGIINGGLGTWDNVHTTRNYHVDLPLPLPPGCPECVHFHWRWEDSFGTRFGDGTPQIEGGIGTAGNVMIPRKYVPSNQDVQIALVLNKVGEDDPFNAWSLANSEVLSPDSGAVVWYLATGKQQSDTFFAHGGFFSPLTETVIDGSVVITPPSNAKVGTAMNYTFTMSLISPTSLSTSTPLKLLIALPATFTYVSVIGTTPLNLGGCSYAAPTHMVECDAPFLSASSATVTLRVIPTIASSQSLKATVNTVLPDTNVTNNQATHTITITP